MTNEMNPVPLPWNYGLTPEQIDAALATPAGQELQAIFRRDEARDAAGRAAKRVAACTAVHDSQEQALADRRAERERQFQAECEAEFATAVDALAQSQAKVKQARDELDAANVALAAATADMAPFEANLRAVEHAAEWAATVNSQRAGQQAGPASIASGT